VDENDENRPLWPYEEVAAAIRHLIDAGMPPGTPLPSTKQLAQSQGVSVKTARKALRVLEGEGRVRVVKSMGSFVAPP